MTAHAEFLRAATDDPDLARQLKQDFRHAELDPADRTMLEFVETLTLAPASLEREHGASLRRAGWSEIEILHIVVGCAHFNYLNRMADGLGIRLEYESDLPAFTTPAEAPPAAPGTRGGRPGVKRPAGAGRETPNEAEEAGELFRPLEGNPEAARIAREWRAFQLRPTADLDATLRARIALLICALDRWADGIEIYQGRLDQLGAAAGVEALAHGEVPGADPRERLLLEHARRLGQAPWTTRREHVDELRAAGCDDLAVLRLTMLASYLSFESRVALGLGAAAASPRPS